MSVSKPTSRLLWSALIFLVVIGIAAVTRRSSSSADLRAVTS